MKKSKLTEIKFIKKEYGRHICLYKCECGEEFEERKSLIISGLYSCKNCKNIKKIKNKGFRKKFSEQEFLLAIRTSKSHKETYLKLGYKGCNSSDGTLYAQFFKKLNPDISHFSKSKYIKSNIPYPANSIEYKREYHKIKIIEDFRYKIKKILRDRFKIALKNNAKKGSAIRDLGCSIDKFKLWMEMLWTEGMSWDNYGQNGWVIDHVKPLCSFDLSDKTQVLEAVHFSNLQPLWAEDNLKKADKY